MTNFFNSKIKHFSLLDKEWSRLEKQIKLNKKILKNSFCPICGKKNYEILFTKKSLNFVRCKCKGKLVYINPSINEKYLHKHFKYSKSWKIWSKNVLKSKNKIREDNKKFKDIKKFLKDKTTKNFSLLDVGCSSGNFLTFSKKNLTTNCYGIEPSVDAYKIAKQNNLNVINTSFENFKTKKKFDLICFWASFEYCYDLKLVTTKIKQLLKSNGLLLIYISGNSSSLIMRMLREKCVGFIFNRTHYFSPQSLEYFFKKNKMKKIFEKSFLSEINVITSYLDYNAAYDKKEIPLSLKKFSINLEKNIFNNEMGYKFLTIFKK